jgi:hypothetical protein
MLRRCKPVSFAFEFTCMLLATALIAASVLVLLKYQADALTPYRWTTTAYANYPAHRIIGLPSKVAVYNSAGTTKLAETENLYDDTGSYTDSNNQAASYFINSSADTVIQHDETN